jgi:hypothetical protein
MRLAEYRMKCVKTGGGPLKENNIHTSKELQYKGNYIMVESSSLLKLRFFISLSAQLITLVRTHMSHKIKYQPLQIYGGLTLG